MFPTSTTFTLNVTETVKNVQQTTVNFLSNRWMVGGVVIAVLIVALMSQSSVRKKLRKEVDSFRADNVFSGLARELGYLILALMGALVISLILLWFEGPKSPNQVSRRFLDVTNLVASSWFVVRVIRVLRTAIITDARSSGIVNRFGRFFAWFQILTRLLELFIILIALVCVIIISFPSARFGMGSLFASAGLVSIIAGLAARSTLSNVLAGIQLVATEAIRVDDLVVANSQRGTIEEIALTYVVMRTKDKRCLILPSTYFTETPFENWSRERTQHVQVDLNGDLAPEPVIAKQKVRSSVKRRIAGGRRASSRRATASLRALSALRARRAFPLRERTRPGHQAAQRYSHDHRPEHTHDQP